MGLIGLGRMGANMARRIQAAGHTLVGYDVDSSAVDALAGEGIVTPAHDLDTLVSSLSTPRVVWVMIPTQFVTETIEKLRPLLERDDVVVDGGNSFYRDDVDRAADLADDGIHHVDVGVSGGVWGLDRGYCLMVGGDPDPVSRLVPIFEALAPGVDAAPRTSTDGPVTPQEQGWLHCGPAGAGHFVKMVHNGIEYGIMASYAEGMTILERANAGSEQVKKDAETAPLREPQYYRYDLDIPAIAEVWRRGAVIGSWLLDLTAKALSEDPDMEGYAGRVSDSGEGRWTVQAAVDVGVPANVLASALHQRFSSRDQGDYGDKLLSAMRRQFGGHHER